MKQGEIKETEGTFITPTQKVGVIKVPSKVKKSQYLITTCTNNPTSAIQIASFLIFDGKQHPKNFWFRGC